MCLWTRKKRLNFGSHPRLDPDPGIFWRILLQRCNLGHFFLTLWPTSLELLFMKISPEMCLRTRKSSLHFGSDPNPDCHYYYYSAASYKKNFGLQIFGQIRLGEGLLSVLSECSLFVWDAVYKGSRTCFCDAGWSTTTERSAGAVERCVADRPQ